MPLRSRVVGLPPRGVDGLSLGFQAPWSCVARPSAWLFRPLHWPRMAAVARGPALSQTSRSTVLVACCTT